MKKRIIPLLLVFCLLAVGLVTPAVAVDENAEAPVTTITDASGELEWTLVNSGDYKSVTSVESNDDITIAYSRNNLTALDANFQPISSYTAGDLLLELGLRAEEETGYFSGLIVIDDTFYIPYYIWGPLPWEEEAGWTGTIKAGILRTEDGVTFEDVALSFQVKEIKNAFERYEEVLSLTIRKFNDTYIVYPFDGAAYDVVDGKVTVPYYISTDLENWTECQSPAFEGGKYYKESFQIATITETGVYFKANTYEFAGAYDADHGIYFTNDFQNYTCITEGIYKKGEFYVASSKADLPGNNIAIIASDCYEDDYPSCEYGLYLYNEETGELTHILQTEEVWRSFRYNFTHVDPLTVYVRPCDWDDTSDNSFVIYSASSQDPSATVKYTLPYAWKELSQGYKWWDWEFDGKVYSFDSLFMSDGTQAYMLVSSDYWETACRFDISSGDMIPSKILSVSYTHSSEDTDAAMVLFCDNGIYTCTIKELATHLNPLTVLTDEETGVTVTASTTGALPEGTELAVSLVSDENGTTVYEINLRKDENAIQPTYPVYVKIPIPAEKTGLSYNVYRVEADGTKTTMKAETVGEYIRFATDHFSQYIIEWTNAEPPVDDPDESENLPETSGTPETGDDQGALLPFVVLLSGAMSIVLFVGLRRSRKMTESR